MSHLDFELKLDESGRLDLGGRKTRVRLTPSRIFIKVFFSALAVALSIYVWRQRSENLLKY